MQRIINSTNRGGLREVSEEDSSSEQGHGKALELLCSGAQPRDGLTGSRSKAGEHGESLLSGALLSFHSDSRRDPRAEVTHDSSIS